MKTAIGKTQAPGRQFNPTPVPGRNEGVQPDKDSQPVCRGNVGVERIPQGLEQERLQQGANDKLCAALNRFHDEHGSFAAEYSNL
ncbi:hypothetical protein AZOA_30020 [Azoarcus sp. Aa7]|nr:hypothetical protein [Azoarcus sp. Aa7]